MGVQKQKKDSLSVMLGLTLGKIGKEAEFGIDILIQQSRRFIHLQSYGAPLMGYICALGSMLAVCMLIQYTHIQ